MFRDLPSYDQYATNDSSWLGPLPSHWTTQRTKSLLSERGQKGFPEEPLLAATQSHGVIRKSDYGTRTVTASKDLHLLKLVEVGDFVISLRSFQGGIERCYHRGIISPAYTVLTASSAGYREYLTYLFKSKPFISSLTLAVTGIREGQSIDYSTLAVDLLPVPPAEEQAAIVKYLAHANARIDNAIVAKRRLIELLQEQRAGTVDDLVTGRDKPLQSVSSLPWLESVPEGWEWRRCRTITRFITSGSRGWAEFYADQGPIFLQSGNLGRQLDLKLSNLQRVDLPESASEGIRTRVQPRDLLMCITGALTGNVSMVPADWTAEAYINQHIALIRPAHDAVDAEFLGLAMKSRSSQIQLRASEYGGTKQGLGLAEVKNLEILMPPLADQRAVIARIADRTARLDRAIESIGNEIALLREFRTRLVADVVTGLVDVRAIAATLPDAPETSDKQMSEPEDDLEEALSESEK